MAGPVPPYLTTQTAAQTAFTVSFGLLTLVNTSITTATAAGQFNTTVDSSLFTATDVSNLRIYLDSLGYRVEFAKDTNSKSLLIDWGQPLDIDNSGGTATTVNQGTTPWVVAIDQTGDNNDVDVIATVLAPNAATEITLDAVKTDLDKFQFDGSGNLKVNVELETPETVTVVQPTGTNLHTVVDSGTVVATQGTSPWVVSGSIGTSPNVNVHDGAGNTISSTGTSLDVNVTDFPATVAVTQSTSPWVVSGTVTANLGTVDGLALDATLTNGTQTTQVTGNVTVVQPTGTNLHTVVDSGTITLNGTSPVSGTVTANQGTPNITANKWPMEIVDSGGTNVATVDATGDLQVDVNNFPVLQAVAIDQTGDNNDVDVINGAGAAAVNIQDGGNSITVDGTVAVSNFPATQPVSGTVAATQSGEWDVNIEDTAGNALTSTANALDVNIKSTGVTQPVSGTVTANQGTSPWIMGIDQTGDNNDVDIINGVGADAVNIQDGGNSITVDGTVSTNQITSGTATLSNVAGSAASVTILASNASRKMAMIQNDSASSLYLKFGTTASISSYTVLMVSNSYYELPNPVYTGRLDGIWLVATGNARVTELT